MTGRRWIRGDSSSTASDKPSNGSNRAAIVSEMSAELYGLRIDFAKIEDNPNNQTRFFVISRSPAKRSGNDKTAVLFTTAHKAGALAEVLNLFARYNVNLTNIDNRPSKRRNWEYYFFVDAEGHVEDENLKNALEEVAKNCNELHVLGSFPCATGAI